MKDDQWKMITSFLGVIAMVGGFIYWHFKTVNGFKDEIHKLEIKYKGLEENDHAQQREIERLSKFYSLMDIIINKIISKWN